MTSAELWQDIQRIADRRSPAFQRLFSELIAKVRGGLPQQQIAEALARGAVHEAYALAERAFSQAAEAVQASIVEQMHGALVAAGTVTAQTIPHKASITFRFDIVNEQSVAWIKRESARLLKDVSADTQAMVRAQIQRAFQDGITADVTARAIRDSIGLTSRMEAAVTNYGAQLREAGGAQATIDKAIGRYRDTLIRQRAETIARTEIMRASNQGQQDAWRQAVDRGFLIETPVQVWIVTPDDRLCPACKPMKGQRRAIGEDFVSPHNGATAKTPPLHPRCRCALGLDIKASRERQRAAA